MNSAPTVSNRAETSAGADFSSITAMGPGPELPDRGHHPFLFHAVRSSTARRAAPMIAALPPGAAGAVRADGPRRVVRDRGARPCQSGRSLGEATCSPCPLIEAAAVHHRRGRQRAPCCRPGRGGGAMAPTAGAAGRRCRLAAAFEERHLPSVESRRVPAASGRVRWSTSDDDGGAGRRLPGRSSWRRRRSASHRSREAGTAASTAVAPVRPPGLGNSATRCSLPAGAEVVFCAHQYPRHPHPATAQSGVGERLEHLIGRCTRAGG